MRKRAVAISHVIVPGGTREKHEHPPSGYSASEPTYAGTSCRGSRSAKCLARTLSFVFFVYMALVKSQASGISRRKARRERLVQLVLLYSLRFQNVQCLSRQLCLMYTAHKHTSWLSNNKYTQTLSSTERGHNGNVSLTENFYSPEDPNFRYLY